MSKRKIVNGIILFSIYLVVFLYLVRYVSNNDEIVERISGAEIKYVAFGLASSLISVVLTALMDVTFAKVYNVRIRCLESVKLTFVASAINLIIPFQLGSAVKAVYLKKRMSLAYSKYVAIASGSIIISIFITIVQLVVCLIVATSRWKMDNQYTLLLLAILGVLAMLVFFVCSFQKHITSHIPFKKYTLPIIEGLFELARNKTAIFSVIANLICQACIGSMRFYLIFKCLDFDISVMYAGLYYGLYISSTILPIIPGNIGISEALVGITSNIFGSNFSIGVTVVMINRVFYYIVTAVGTLFSVIPLWYAYNCGKEDY